MTNVYLDEGITVLGKEMFMSCTSIVSITIPNTVTELGYGVFWSCSSLEQIIIPSSVVRINQYAFKSCRKLQHIYCEFESQPERWDNGWRSECSAAIHWLDSWQYVDGKPTLK